MSLVYRVDSRVYDCVSDVCGLWVGRRAYSFVIA